jgi:cytochrome P450
METLRISELVAFPPFHCTSDDVTLRGYSIPRDTFVFVNLSSVMTDADIWGDPENFRPERFIAPDGSLIRKEELIPFGIGKSDLSCHNVRL